MLRLRPLDRRDQAQVLALNAAALPHVAPLDAMELSRLLALSAAHRVAEREGRLLGYMLAFAGTDAYDGEEFERFRAELTNGFTYIDQVVIAASARGVGLGRTLYDALAASARAQGHRWLCCEVNVAPPNPDSFAFHARLGFRGSAELDTRDGRRVALLVKPVGAAT